MGETPTVDWLERYNRLAAELRDLFARRHEMTPQRDARVVLQVLSLLDNEVRSPERVEPTYRVLQSVDDGVKNPGGLATALVEAVLFCMPSEAPQMETVLKLQDEARQQMAEARRELEAHKQSYAQFVTDQLASALKQAHESATRAAASAMAAGATAHASAFEKRSVAYGKAATKWLVCIAVGAIGWVAGAVVSAHFAGANTPWPVLALRFVALSFGLALLGFFARAYSANRHNCVVNEHRATALQTMEAFISASSDSETRNAVILQVTAGTFATLPTGYEGRGTAVPNTQAIDLLKAAKESR